MGPSSPKQELGDLTRFIVEYLVDDPDEVDVTETDEDGEPVIVIDVPPDARGAVIGRQGRTIRAIELVVRAAAGASPVPVIEIAGG